MDKQTGSNSSRQGTSESRDISLGCGQSKASPAAAASPTPAAGAPCEGAAGNSPFASFTAHGTNQSQQIPAPITLDIHTTTGGNFPITVNASNSVENLRKVIAKKLKVSKDRICLLHREKELQEGSLKENGLMDGSKIILIPNVETGLLTQRPENTVMQALESLNDHQVNDFLSGKTPLNLSMRLGDHMMLIQLQLSTVNPASAAPHASSSSSSSRTRSSQRGSRSSSAAAGAPHHSHHHHHANASASAAAAAPAADASHRQRVAPVAPWLGDALRSSDAPPSPPKKLDYATLRRLARNFSMAQQVAKMAPPATTAAASAAAETKHSPGDAATSSALPSSEGALLEQSPIKSLSNLVCSPIKTTALKDIPVDGAPATEASCQDPISAKLTSCLCTRLNGAGVAACTANGSARSCVDSAACQSRQDASDAGAIESPAPLPAQTMTAVSCTAAGAASPSSLTLHKTANNPIVRPKHRHHHHHHHHHHHYHHHSSSASSSRRVSASSRGASANDSGFTSENDLSIGAPASPPAADAASGGVELDDSGVTLTDTRTLAEASRNLTQTLRKLSKEVFGNKMELATEEAPRKGSSGAVIESMKNHGKGIYSGTFSGTLNPALQDRYGRPKRDISTVIHILNDLLSATPHYSRGAHISFEAPPPTSAHVGRGKGHTSKHHHHSSSDSCAKCASRAQQQSAPSGGGCAYGECNGHYTAAFNKPIKHAAPFMCCPDAGSIGQEQQHHAADASGSKERKVCSCRFRVHSETGERVREAEHMCHKCLVEMENSKTKSKLDQLRLVMQQRKQKREARKLKGAPYGARVVGATAEVAASEAGAATVTATCTGTGGQVPPLTTPLAAGSPSDAAPNHIAEEVNTAA